MFFRRQTLTGSCSQLVRNSAQRHKPEESKSLLELKSRKRSLPSAKCCWCSPAGAAGAHSQTWLTMPTMRGIARPAPSIPRSERGNIAAVLGAMDEDEDGGERQMCLPSLSMRAQARRRIRSGDDGVLSCITRPSLPPVIAYWRLLCFTHLADSRQSYAGHGWRLASHKVD